MPEPRQLLRDHTTLRLGGPAALGRGHHRGRAHRGRRRAPTPPASPCWCSAAAATWWSPTRLRRHRRRGRDHRRASTSRTAPACGGVTVDRRRRRELGRPGRPRRRRGLGRRRGAVRHPRRVGATPIQNVGAYGQEVAETIARSATWDRHAAGRPHVRQRRLRLRLPHQPVQGETPGRYVVLEVTFQLRAGHPRRAGAVRRAGRASSAWSVGERGAAGRRPRGRARAARQQGHGARRGRPRHLERRLVLHQPGRRRRRACPRVPPPGRSPTAG